MNTWVPTRTIFLKLVSALNRSLYIQILRKKITVDWFTRFSNLWPCLLRVVVFKLVGGNYYRFIVWMSCWFVCHVAPLWLMVHVFVTCFKSGVIKHLFLKFTVIHTAVKFNAFSLIVKTINQKSFNKNGIG